MSQDDIRDIVARHAAAQPPQQEPRLYQLRQLLSDNALIEIPPSLLWEVTEKVREFLETVLAARKSRDKTIAVNLPSGAHWFRAIDGRWHMTDLQDMPHKPPADEVLKLEQEAARTVAAGPIDAEYEWAQDVLFIVRELRKDLVRRHETEAALRVAREELDELRKENGKLRGELEAIEDARYEMMEAAERAEDEDDET